MTTITPSTPSGTPPGAPPRGPAGRKGRGVGGAAAAVPARTLLDRVLERDALIVLGVLTAGVVLLFRQWLYGQHLHSWGNGDWSHAYFVPLISLYLIWQDRERLERAPVGTFWPGLIPLLMGVWCYVFFMVGVPTHLGQGLSLVLTVFGLCLLMLGPRAMESLFVPIGYLVFAITVPEMVMNTLTYPLQDMAAKGGYVLLTMVGVNADLSGNTITVLKGNGTPIPLNVAETCSGMRMVIAFLALGVAVALLGTRAWWKRVVLLGLAAPFAVLLNVVRVGVLGLFSLVNPNFSSGASHTLIGTLLLIPGFFLFLGILTAMNKAVPEAPAPKAGPSPGPAGVAA